MPLPFKFASGATVLGSYQVAQKSGSIAATPSAGDHWGRLRWNPSVTNARCVLLRCRAALSVITAITTMVQEMLQISIARSYTVDHTTAMTQISMAGDSGKMDGKNMGSSLMGTAGPGICTTTTMSGQTLTLDTAPFGIVNLAPLSPTLGAAAVTAQVGCGSEMVDLYNWEDSSRHPPTLKAGEGFVVQTTLAGHVNGTVALLLEWSWAEVINPFGND